MENNWKKYFEDEFGSRGFVGTGITKLETVEQFIQTELDKAYSQGKKDGAEEVIEEMPEYCGYFTCDMGDCLEPIKNELRAKYLTNK